MKHTASASWPRWWVPAAALWFACWHFFMYRNVWSNPLRYVQGPIGDNLVMLWNLGWVRHALSNGNAGFWFENAFYPEGFLFLFSTHTWLDGVLCWLVSAMLPQGLEGVVLWYNIVQVAATIVTGVAAIAILRCWGVRRWPLALLGASVVAFCWFRSYASIGHQHFYGTQWVLLALLLVSWSRRLLVAGYYRKGLMRAGWAGALLGLTFLNDQTHTVFGSILFVFVFAALFFGRRRASGRKCFMVSAVAAAVFLLVSLVHLIPFMQAVRTGRFEYSVPNLSIPRLVDATSIFVPNDRHGIVGNWMMRIRAGNNLRVEEGAYIGTVTYVFLFAGLLGALISIRLSSKGLRNPWRMVFWSTAAGCTFVVFALGDYLQVGREIYIQMPGRILRHLPVLNNIRLPQRWIWPAQLTLVLAGTLALSFRYLGGWQRMHTYLCVALAAFAANEGKWHPLNNPLDVRDPWLNPPGLAGAIRQHWKAGGVLVMPLEYRGSPAHPHSNFLQLVTGFDIPFTIEYVARAPFDVSLAPLKEHTWSSETDRWLKSKKVGMIVFVYEDGDGNAWREWIKQAKDAVPGLVVLNKSGHQI